VLAGDWLYMQAFQIALRERNFHILDILISLTQMMVEGELLQLERIGRIDISEADYIELVDRKTASLFSACARLGAIVAGADERTESRLGEYAWTCARLGAIVAGADERTESRLGEYAWNLGIAFQLTDDILDFTARENILGKPVGNDLREGKVTLPLIYALSSGDIKGRLLVETILRNGNYDGYSVEDVRAFLDDYHAVDRARARAHEFAAKARAIIAEFPESPYQRALAAVAELVTDRDY
jgi:octaprenyl-diphosphate synthase